MVAQNSYRMAARVRTLQANAKAHPMRLANGQLAVEQVAPDIVLALSVNA